MIDHAVFPLLLPSMVCLLVPADSPRVIVDHVDRVADVVVDVADDIDQHHEDLEGTIDKKVLNGGHLVFTVILVKLSGN